jgi:hypothetical protein
MFFKRYKEYSEKYKKDQSILDEKDYALWKARYKLEKMIILVNKIFLIEANTDDEFNEKYNNFMLKNVEGINQGESFTNRTKLGSIFIKNKSKIEFSNNRYVMSIEYEEYELKNEYSNEDYLKAKYLLKKLEKEYKEYENRFNEKYNK